MEKLLYNRFLLVKDNFYDEPSKVIAAAKTQPFTNQNMSLVSEAQRSIINQTLKRNWRKFLE
ncbi:MAG: hypothetical protein IPH24_18005 [Crocinitomicaceae bacterium]|nr:hypothetical protein [Crocinitomicaceae bacterium]